MNYEKVYRMSFSKVYPLLVNKGLKKGRTKTEVDEVILWLTGYDQRQLEEMLKNQVDYAAFFQDAPKLNDNRHLIKGRICGIRVEEMDKILRNI